MSGHTRLYRRGSTYYHRASIPVDIKDTYPKTEETFSLKTKDYNEALRLVRIAAVEVDQRFEAHRQSLKLKSLDTTWELTEEQIKQLGQVYYAYLLDDDEDTRLLGFSKGELYDASDFGNGKGQIPEDDPRFMPRKTFEEFTEEGESMDQAARYYNARGEVDAFYYDESDIFLGDAGINLHPDSPSRVKLARELQAATIRAHQAIRQRNLGDVVETPVVAQPAPASTAPMLSKVMEGWIDEKTRTTWIEKTAREHRVWMEHFITVVGDKPISDYTKADGRDFKAMLMKLPANWNKFQQFKKLSIVRAAEKAHQGGMTPMSDRNVNKIMGFVGSFWRWAEVNYDECTLNPMQGLTIATRKRARDARDPFTVDELTVMFNTPLYTGCESLRRWKTPGDLLPKDAGIYWVPLISLYSGARAGEIIQLYVEDIHEQDGVVYFDLNASGDDKRLKSQSSWRQIPVHRELIKMGLLDLVETRRAEHSQRLFPDLPIGQDGYYSSPFSKHFSRFLKEAGVKRRKNAFHSFRHCFEDACRNSGVSHEIMNALQGHAETGMSARYGSGYALEVLAKAMEQIKYKGLDLAHLYKLRVVSPQKSEHL